MAYRLNITEHAEELLDDIVYHLLFRLKNEQAARHLLDNIDCIYERLEENPVQFPASRDKYLAKRDYVIVFDVREGTVNVVGIFHQLENYQRKL